MNKKSIAISYGAITIINAIASGIGAAHGIDLWTKAEVELIPGGEITAEIIGERDGDTTLIKTCVTKVFDKFNISDMGAKIITQSNIPIARGLKSSSAAANAVTLAVIKALELKLTDEEIINIGVDAAIESNVSITGAFDDASAAYLGGIVLTDNLNRKILFHDSVDTSLKVVLFIPQKKILTKSVDVNKIKLIKNLISPLVELVKNKQPYLAMTLNGFLYGGCLNTNFDILFAALEHNVLGVSISGTGPSIAAVVHEADVDKVLRAWRNFDGELKVVNTNNKKAHLIK
ncbi:MAG: shikimate kinase [Candidatus Odinarchaeia archaeon]